MTDILYGSGGRVQLAGNASQAVQLAHENPIEVTWSPEDRRSMDVEVRVSFQTIPGLHGSSTGAPWIRWGMRTAHGSSLIVEPASTFPLKPEDMAALGEIPRTLLSLMPGRGLHFRTTARELTLLLQNTGYFGEGHYYTQMYGEFMEEEGMPTQYSFPPVVLAVSFQPVEGLQVPVQPRYASLVRNSNHLQWGNFVQFPPAATEWRIFDENGSDEGIEPDYDENDPEFGLKNQANAIRCLDPAGKVITEVLPWEVDEWLPLPHGAWGFQVHNEGLLEGSRWEAPPDGDITPIYRAPLNVEFR